MHCEYYDSGHDDVSRRVCSVLFAFCCCCCCCRSRCCVFAPHDVREAREEMMLVTSWRCVGHVVAHAPLTTLGRQRHLLTVRPRAAACPTCPAELATKFRCVHTHHRKQTTPRSIDTTRWNFWQEAVAKKVSYIRCKSSVSPRGLRW